MCITCADAFIGVALISLYIHVIYSIVITVKNISLSLCVIIQYILYFNTVKDILKSRIFIDVGLY